MTEKFKSKMKKLSDSLKPAKIYGNDVFNKTVKCQKMYGFGMGTGEEATHNNEADAFKRTFMQAEIALKTNLGISKAFGDKHEDDGNKKHNAFLKFSSDILYTPFCQFVVQFFYEKSF